MNNQNALHQQLRELRAAETDLRRRLVDPVAELLVQDEKLKQLVATAPEDYPSAREMMTEVIYLRQVIRELLIPLVETQRRIRQIEAELRGGQDSSDGKTDASHSRSAMSQSDNRSQMTNGHATEQGE